MTVVETASHGTILEMGNGASPEVFTAIGSISDGPNGPNRSYRGIETYPHDSTSVKKKPSVKDNGTLGFTVNWDSADTQHAAVQTAFDAGTVKNWKVKRTDTGAEIETFSGWISSFSKSAPSEGWNTAQVEITLTTAVVSA